jgi:hypothetical protein
VLARIRSYTLGAAIALLVVLLAYLYLMIHEPRIRALETLVSILIDPGWRVANLVFPEGVHAGIAFLLASLAVNLAFYVLLILVLVSIMRRMKATRHPPTR